MKKIALAYVVILSGLLVSGSVKPTNIRIAMNMFLKATTGIRKDIGTAD
ncbi:hypothetical protein NAF17_03110 [Mucilaginibacter sp. RB4R14]|nr:hypothetical protein [Mucilaginibacter aurantiaciroseus]MCO5934519.1 hypothetical protein [Mucilaginibacter aurantiaciroseus]